MTELRCRKCDRCLGKLAGLVGQLELVCRRCKATNLYASGLTVVAPADYPDAAELDRLRRMHRAATVSLQRRIEEGA